MAELVGQRIDIALGQLGFVFRIGSERMLRRLVTGQVVDARAAGAGDPVPLPERGRPRANDLPRSSRHRREPELMRGCRHCGASLAGKPSSAWFCSDAHRKRAQRRRDAGLPEHAYPEGGKRSRLALSTPTLQEHAWELVGASVGELRW